MASQSPKPGADWALEPITPYFGVSVTGFQVADTDDAAFARVLDLFHTYGLVVFRDQDLPPEAYVAFAKRFPHHDSPPIYTDFTLPGFPEIQQLGNYTENGRPQASLNQIGIEWHTDGTSRERPCVATHILSVKTPSQGGDTLFASGYLAYDLLDDETRARIDPLKVRYNYRGIINAVNEASDSEGPVRPIDSSRTYHDVIHPLVRIHPATGRKALWVTPKEMRCIEGLTPEQSQDLVDELMRPGTSEPYAYSHQYRVGDLVVWDNRCMFHSTTPYTYRDEVRLIRRIALNGHELVQ